MINLTKLLLALLILSFAVINTASSTNHNSSFSFNKLSLLLCENAKNNNLYKMRSNLRRAKTHIRSIYPQVNCDGQTLLSLAMVNQAESIVTYLNLKAKREQIIQQNQSISAN